MDDLLNIKTILIGFLIAIILTFIFLDKFNRYILSFFEFTDESLSKQRLFKIAIAGPLLLATSLCLPIWYDSTIKLNLSHVGYQNFLTIFKLPIGVWSLSIPLVAIVAHIHRTIQTASQLEVTRKKNMGDSFFAHHKYITEALSKFPTHILKTKDGEFEKKVSEPYKLYNNLFEKSSYESGLVINDISDKINDIQTLLNTASSYLSRSKIRKDNLRGKVDDFNRVVNAINEINKKLTISIKKSDKNYLYMLKNDVGTLKIVTTYYDEDEFKKDLKYSIELISSICGLMNKRLQIKDTLYYYINVFNERYYFYGDMFSKTVEIEAPEVYGFASNISKSLDEDFERYNAKLKMNMYTNALNKH
ncbi:hypothetical protein NL338_13510 [Klebsiella pneumoniae]|nr:hypothetical protein [Klebsiella pneumoniae]HDU4357929.1 hypothetical protein [Klebsiella pneumoniae]HDU4362666.1 hypothetical protein [Klebsiella pneumoniae subsp. pneumoniae]